MKVLKFKIAFLLVFLPILITISPIKAGQVTKDYHKEFKANDNTELTIQNKYGKVDVKNWDKNSITIDVIITVEHSDQEKAERILSYIDVEFEESGNKVKAITRFDDKFEKFWRGRKKFSIDYTVNMPKNLKLNLSNKYGSVFINEITGRANIEVKYGSLKANKIIWDNTKPLSQVTLGYSNGSIEECKWLRLNIKYSKIEIEESKALVIISKYCSKVHINKSSSIVSESKYDSYQIGHITNFVSMSGYTSYNIEQVDKKIDLETRYGSCKINYVPENFESIKIDSKYTDITIGIDPDASYHLKGEAEYAKIHYPEGGRVSFISENNEMSVSGFVGKDENTKSKVVIYTKYGNIRLID